MFTSLRFLAAAAILFFTVNASAGIKFTPKPIVVAASHAEHDIAISIAIDQAWDMIDILDASGVPTLPFSLEVEYDSENDVHVAVVTIELAGPNPANSWITDTVREILDESNAVIPSVQEREEEMRARFEAELDRFEAELEAMDTWQNWADGE